MPQTYPHLTITDKVYHRVHTARHEGSVVIPAVQVRHQHLVVPCQTLKHLRGRGHDVSEIIVQHDAVPHYEVDGEQNGHQNNVYFPPRTFPAPFQHFDRCRGRLFGFDPALPGCDTLADVASNLTEGDPERCAFPAHRWGRQPGITRPGRNSRLSLQFLSFYNHLPGGVLREELLVSRRWLILRNQNRCNLLTDNGVTRTGEFRRSRVAGEKPRKQGILQGCEGTSPKGLITVDPTWTHDQIC